MFACRLHTNSQLRPTYKGRSEQNIVRFTYQKLPSISGDEVLSGKLTEFHNEKSEESTRKISIYTGKYDVVTINLTNAEYTNKVINTTSFRK